MMHLILIHEFGSKGTSSTPSARTVKGCAGQGCCHMLHQNIHCYADFSTRMSGAEVESEGEEFSFNDFYFLQPGLTTLRRRPPPATT